jgi:hypothetical protein
VNIPAEMSLVDFVSQTLINCGRNATVVNEAAIKPIIIIESIGFSELYCVLNGILGFAAIDTVHTKIAIIRILHQLLMLLLKGRFK